MYIRDIFRIGGVASYSIREYLGQDNCQISKIIFDKDKISLHLKRKEDNQGGHASLKVKEEYKENRKELFGWVSSNQKNIIGLTLNELRDLEINFK